MEKEEAGQMLRMLLNKVLEKHRGGLPRRNL